VSRITRESAPAATERGREVLALCKATAAAVRAGVGTRPNMLEERWRRAARAGAAARSRWHSGGLQLVGFVAAGTGWRAARPPMHMEPAAV
jgi:hypothetical protein